VFTAQLTGHRTPSAPSGVSSWPRGYASSRCRAAHHRARRRVPGKSSQRRSQQLRVHHLRLGPSSRGRFASRARRTSGSIGSRRRAGSMLIDTLRAMVGSHAATVPRRGS
jgi:hypothetical protein